MNSIFMKLIGLNGRNPADGSISDSPYTAYWNKYHPKSVNGNSITIQSDLLINKELIIQL